MADKSSSSGKKPIPSYRAMSLQEEHQMFTASVATPRSSETRDPAPAPSLEMVVYEPTPMPYAQIFPGQPGNPIDPDNLPTVIPTSVLREIVNRPMPTKRSRRPRNIAPGEIPPAIPRSQSGPRRPTPLEQMNLVDEENIQSDSDDDDYQPPTSAKAPSFLPDLSPEELESIAAAVTPSAAATLVGEILAPADVSTTPVDETPTPTALSPPPADEIPVIAAPSNPIIPHTDFFSDENIGASIPEVSEPITPGNIHTAGVSESDDSVDEVTLADMLTSLKKNSKKSPKTSKPLPVAGNAVNIGGEVNLFVRYLKSSTNYFDSGCRVSRGVNIIEKTWTYFVFAFS
ncbi:hypothetical protein CASFOL_040216 [Castilleja foliolosa]|uniref:Uncharacterized protein n=1 Tax=Castilleja foliolosa TaxID=1961234 RepID=A0ABD3BF67_9LAMI